MEASVEILIGMMVVLVLVTLGLVAYLIRGLRKRGPTKVRDTPLAEGPSVEMDEEGAAAIRPAAELDLPSTAVNAVSETTSESAEPERTMLQPAAPAVVPQPASTPEPGATLISTK